MKWTNRKSMTYDSFEGDYMIFIRRNKEFNEIARWNIEHICLIKDERIMKMLIKRMKETNKQIIYIKRSTARDIFREFDLSDYKIIVYKTSLKDEREDIETQILSSINSVKNEEINKREVKEQKDEEDEDEELDIEILST